MNSDINVYFFGSKDELQKSFLDGVLEGYFYLNKSQKRNVSLSFIDLEEIDNFECKSIQTKTKKIIYLEKKFLKKIKKCEIKKNNNILFIKANDETLELDFNYLDPFYSYVEYLFNLNLDLLPEETIIFSDKKLFNKQQFFIDEDSNIEKEISTFFEINKSADRKRDLEQITQKRIYNIPRFREDIKNIIIDLKSVKAERIIPALKFNLIFKPQIYVLPKQIDFWKTPTSEITSNLMGLEYPILLNNNFVLDEDFSAKKIEEKVFYALGFDSLLYLGKGLNSKFKGLLGEYLQDDNKVFIKPERIGF